MQKYSGKWNSIEPEEQNPIKRIFKVTNGNQMNQKTQNSIRDANIQ